MKREGNMWRKFAKIISLHSDFQVRHIYVENITKQKEILEEKNLSALLCVFVFKTFKNNCNLKKVKGVNK